MELGPDEGSKAPALPEALRMKIPRSSFRYFLIRHLGHRYRYTTKKPTFTDAKKLAKAVFQICKKDHPEVLDSKVERLFREKGWKIIWTPPLLPQVPAHRARLGRRQAAGGHPLLKGPRP